MFPEENVQAAARRLLDRYASESGHQGVERVQLAILRCSEGDLTVLSRTVEDALLDYRDILSSAEYPGYSALGLDVPRDSDASRAAIRADAEQYKKWIDG